MNYVVQNFYNLNWNLLLTTKLRLLIFQLNFNKFFFLLKLHLYFTIIKTNHFANKFMFNLLFYPCFKGFVKTQIKLLDHTNPINTLNLKNNLSFSLIFNLLDNCYNSLTPNLIQSNNIKLGSNFLCNLYFYSTKYHRVQITKKFYNQSAYFILVFLTQFWFAYSNNFRFYLNHLYIFTDYFIYLEFYNYFFKVLNV